MAFLTISGLWSSPDGLLWSQVMAATAFTERISHTSVVYNDKIYVIGGRNQVSDAFTNDVWFLE